MVDRPPLRPGETTMPRTTVVTLLVLALVAPTLGAEEPKKSKKPSLAVPAAPRMAFSPGNVFFTAELTGGHDVEELYCPQVQWQWGDGGNSLQGSDWPPFEPGTKIHRRL